MTLLRDKIDLRVVLVENITSRFVLHQVLKEPSHILHTSSLFTDLIFTSQPNWITESGVYSSLHPKCHHETCYAKFNLEIKYPILSIREACHYKDANIEPIRQQINEFN